MACLKFCFLYAVMMLKYRNSCCAPIDRESRDPSKSIIMCAFIIDF